MYAHIEFPDTARTDAIIHSLSWMHYTPAAAPDTDQSSSAHDGWLATGNANHIVSVTYTSVKSDDDLITPDRTNFNLRAHRTDVRLVSWNVPYEKLATVDEKGVIFVWVKHDNRWSLELINDRNHPVIDMAWSPDGRTTVICYEDDFVLAGSVTGQRYWSTVLNIPLAKVSAVSWMPDASHVVLGTTGGQLVVIDHHGNTTGIFPLTSRAIRQLSYSCSRFYSDALNSNAARFVNDDYILACSLDNGHVLFLTHHLDTSPIVVETSLQNIKMDWSSPGEILVVGGHQRTSDTTYKNQLIFYTRRGEFLHRLQIPQTTHPVSALCWAHGNEIVFVACGCYVYTVWITHQPLPSMLALCQMKIKQQLLHHSLQNLDKLHLPNNLKCNLLSYYRSTIKGFLPDQKHLHSFVCNPLKSQLRLQCTMKRVDNNEDSTPTGRTTQNLSGAIYVLYLEYLGGLIPLLTARRTSKLCPDFIIYDPKIKTDQLSVSSPFRLHSPQALRNKKAMALKSPSNTFQNVADVQPSKTASTANRPALISNRHSIYAAENGVANDNGSSRAAKADSDCSSSTDSDEDDDDGQALIDPSERQPRKKLTSKANKLCTIAANIWGTRFKFYGHSSHLPEVLGSVAYKTSFLHLQPRQMTVTIATNCHTRKAKQSRCTKTARKRTKPATNAEPRPARRSQRTSIATTTVVHHYRQAPVDASTVDSSSASPMNLSRSTSPATSVANFIRPISPPCIQVREPLSPKFTRASSITLTSPQPQSHPRSTATSTAAPPEAIPDVPESCFEPETYRNLSPLNSNPQKKLSFSDPTLNQTTRTVRRSQPSTCQQTFSNDKPTHAENDDGDDVGDEIESLASSDEASLAETTQAPVKISRKKYASPRHRMMTCTRGVSDSMPELIPSSDGQPNDTTSYIMQNRPPLWNEQSQVYQLDFGGRVTLESAKNFQIEFKGKQVIQFGRIENNCYTLDFEWPFSPLQAFAVALANITQRLK